MKSTTLRTIVDAETNGANAAIARIRGSRRRVIAVRAFAAIALVQCIGMPQGWAQSDGSADPYSYMLPPGAQLPSSMSPTSPDAAPAEWYVAPSEAEELVPEPYGSATTAARYDGLPERRTFEKVNLTIELPGGAWRELKAPSTPTTAVVLLIQQDPEIAVVIGGESLGVELKMPPEMALKTSQSLARQRMPGVTFSNEQALAVRGLMGTRYEAHGTAQGIPLYGVIWTAERNGYLYHVLAFGGTNQVGAVEAAHRLFRERVAPIDATRVAHADETKLIKTFESANYGYRIDLENMGWLQNDEPESVSLGEEFSAVSGHLALMVIPMPLPGRPVDFELLSQVCLRRLKFEYPGPEIWSAGPYQLGGLQGQKFEARRSMESGVIDYRFRLVASHTAAYLIIGLALDGDAASMARVEAALDRMTLTGRPLPSELQLTPDNRVANGLMLNNLGISYYQRGDLAAALDFVTSAYKFHPTDQAILSNYVDTLSELGRTPEALAILEQHLVKYPGNQDVRATRAKLLGENGRSDEARQIYTELFASGYVDEPALVNYLELAGEAKAYDEAIATVRQFALRRPTVDVQMTLASLYSEKGEHNTAISQLTALHTQNPNNLEVKLRLARAYGDAERFDEALSITQKLLDSGQRDEVTWLLHGKHQLHAERFAEAKRTFEQAVQQYPHSEYAKELLKIASNQLGQGDNSALTTPIAPVDIPQEVRSAIQQAPVEAATGLEKYGAEEQVHIVGVSYQRGQPLRTTECCRIKLHTTGGVKEYSALTFDLNPTAERFYVNRLVVFDASGKQVAQGSVDTYYVVDDSSSGVASNAKIVTVPVPGLKAGHTVEYMVTREDRAPSEQFSFDEVVLSSSVPVGVSAYYVAGDVQTLKHKTSLPVRVESTGNLLYCVVANPRPYREEIKQPSIEHFLPILWVGEAGSTWEAETHEYLKMVAEKLTLDDATRQLATELTRDCKTNREKLAVLAGYTQSTCTYHGIEFGRRARVPNTSAQTLALKYGDCKDHALLLKQLLAGVGIPAELAVVNASQPIAPELPSLDQFDHMVLFVPGEAIGQAPNEIGGLIVDATQKNADPLLFPPHGMANKSFLVLDAARPRIVHTPALPLDAQQLTCERRIVIRPNAQSQSLVELDVQERLTLNPYIAPGMRAYLRSFEPGERREALQSVLCVNQNVRLKRVDVEYLENLSQPLVLNLQYTLPDALHLLATGPTGNTLVGRIPAPWETYFLEAEYLESRETPFEVTTPRLVRSSFDVVLPNGYRLADAKRLSGTGQTRFASWASRARATGSNVHVDHLVRVPAGRFTAQEYSSYYAGMKEALTALQTPLTFRADGLVAAQPSTTLVR